MWIFDSYCKGCVELWNLERGLNRVSVAYPPSFCNYLKDIQPHRPVQVHGLKSYWSYGKVNHKDGALVPEGRVLIDTAKSFVYTECGLNGVWVSKSYP
jgi:hypothetical protein